VYSVTTTQCAYEACVIESNFVNRVAEYIIPGAPAGFANLEEVKARYLHSTDFDNIQGCPISVGVDSGKACCGAVPERVPYKITVKECCADGTIGVVGSGC